MNGKRLPTQAGNRQLRGFDVFSLGWKIGATVTCRPHAPLERLSARPHSGWSQRGRGTCQRRHPGAGGADALTLRDVVFQMCLPVGALAVMVLPEVVAAT